MVYRPLKVMCELLNLKSKVVRNLPKNDYFILIFVGSICLEFIVQYKPSIYNLNSRNGEYSGVASRFLKWGGVALTEGVCNLAGVVRAL